MTALLLFISAAFAAWPDSFPHRIAALDAIRYDLASPETTRDFKEVRRRYQVACQKGYQPACKWRKWQIGETGSATKAATFFDAKCKKKAPLACVVVGISEGMRSGRISHNAPDPDRAFQLFKRACKEKAYAPGCAYMGAMYERGVSVQKSPKLAKKYYLEACKAKDYWACHQLGRLQLNGIGGPASSSAADVHFRKACKNGYSLSCAESALIMQQNGSGSRKRIASLIGQACKAGSMRFCLEFAHLHANGHGVKKSSIMAKAFYEMSCAAEEMAGCHGAAVMMMNSESSEGAMSRFRKACERGYAPSCTQFGLQLLSVKGKTPKRALKLLKTGCDGGDTEGCIVIAKAYLDGKYVKKNEVKAKKLLQAACDDNQGAACFELASISAEDLAWSGKSDLPLFKKACELGDGRGCGELADRIKAKKGMNKKVISLIKKGCKGKNAESCVDLADLRLKRKDSKKALKYLEQACRYGGNDACLRAGKMYNKKKKVTKAMRLFDEACKRGDERSCQEGRPIAFQGRFKELVGESLQSTICHLWSIDPNNPEDVLPIADVVGARFMPYVGSMRSQDIVASLVTESHSHAVKYEGRSDWMIMGTPKDVENLWKNDGGDSDTSEAIWGEASAEDESPDNPWGATVDDGGSSGANQPIDTKVTNPWGKNGENSWSATLTHIETWDPKKGKIDDAFPENLATLRGKKGSIVYNRKTGLLNPQTEGCRFVLTRPQLQAEHCTAVQSLIAGYMMMECQ